MARRKKGFWKKTGCVLISASVILTGLTFFGSLTSEADYDSGTYSTDGGTISDEDLDDYQSALLYVTSTADLTLGNYALDNYTALQTMVVTGN